MTRVASRSTDAELLEQWRSGDTKAGQQLFSRHYVGVERFFLNKVSPDLVSDLVQKSFMTCLENRDRISEGNRFRAYLLTIAYRVFCAHLRKRYREGGSLNPEEISLTALDPSPSSVVTRSREKRLLLEGLRKISVKHQVLLELHYWEDLTTQEIAAVLELPAGTVRGRLQRARRSLEAEMARASRSPALLASTLSGLDDWATGCRDDLDATQGHRA